MPPTLHEIYEAAMGLDQKDRSLLAFTLLDTLTEDGEDVPQEEHAKAWAEVIRRRVQEVRDGSVELIPWEVARREIEEMLSEARKRQRLQLVEELERDGFVITPAKGAPSVRSVLEELWDNEFDAIYDEPEEEESA